MLSLREKIQVAGLFLLMAGLLCLPMPLVNPKSALSLFSALKPSGWFFWLGLGTALAGVAMLAVSAWVKR